MMSYRLSLHLGNPTTSKVRVLIEEGTIFEVRDITSNPSQTLRVIDPVEFELGPGETKPFDLETQCMNSKLRAPSNDPMQLTPFVL